MIQIIGIDHNVPVVVREKFSISRKKLSHCLLILKRQFDEVAIISTCNRTEVYFKSRKEYREVVRELFKAMEWDMKLEQYVHHIFGKAAVEHVMYLACGFHSVIIGEEQILSQFKSAYETALKEKSIKSEFSALFKKAIRCGKEFRHNAKLYKVPVSSSSISVSEARRRNILRYMVVGYGDVGKLTLKYIMASEFEKIYVVLKSEQNRELNNPKVEFIEYGERTEHYKDVDCIISSTSAPHTVIDYDDSLSGKLIFDLAVPRDVAEEVYLSPKTEVYNIDMIKRTDSENQKKRQSIMDKNRYIVEKYIAEFYDWKSVSELTPVIIEVQKRAERITESRAKTFKNKKDSRDIDALAEEMIKSVSNAYVNRAIDVLKAESISGRGEECIEIIKKIFC